jgi:hypothetical protein
LYAVVSSAGTEFVTSNARCAAMPERESGTPTYSVSLRLRRITVEYAYVSVPVTDAIMQTDDHGELKTDEKRYTRIDVEKMVQRGIDIARSGQTRWYPEEEKVEPHPVQKAPDPGEEAS